MAYGKVVARRDDGWEEATVYEWAGGGYMVLVARKGCDYDLGTKFFAKLDAAIAYAELVLHSETRGLLEWAASFGERAALFAEGSPLWIQGKWSRPYLAYSNAKEAATAAFFAVPDLRGEPPRDDPAYVHPHTTCECGHWLCYHVAVRLPCLADNCSCVAFTYPLECGVPAREAN